MYSIKSWFVWCVIPTAVICAPVIWVVHTVGAEQSAAEQACVDRGYTPVLDRRGDVICVVGTPDVHPK